MKISINLILVLFLSLPIHAQKICKAFYCDSISKGEVENLSLKYGNSKTIPEQYQKQILTALAYYPELKNIIIQFRLSEKETPLSTKPTLLSMFSGAKKRIYIVTISTKTSDKLQPILFNNLSFNAQVGVIGHELSHVTDYITKGFGKMSYIFYIEMLSKKKTDVFEYKTDLRCINHGLGYQLLAWSSTVRTNLKCKNWRGAGNLLKQNKTERYLNPDTIKDYLSKNDLYQ